jgi:glycosyltransferase involved in cell wall biosynthesis
MKTTLVLLTLNEIDGLQALFDRLPLDAVDEAFAVDGGSTDGTREFFDSRGFRVVEQHSRGRGEAFRLAFEQSAGDVLIFFSPDGNENPADITRFAAPLDDGADMVIASRMMRGARNEEDDHLLRWRKWANLSFTALANMMWNRQGRVSDTINGFRAIRREAWDAMHLDATDYAIEYQSSIRAFKLGLSVAEFPTCEAPRIGGESYAYSLPTGWRFLRLLWQELRNGTRFEARPAQAV